MQHQDPRAAQYAAMPPGQAPSPAFPPPGFTAELVPAHQDPAQYNDISQNPQPEPAVAESDDGGYGDYFGTDVRHKFMMPDGKQWIEFKELTEGDIAKYNDILNRDITVLKQTGDAKIKINQVEERHALLQVAVTGWHMMRRDRGGTWREQPFSNSGRGSTFMQFLNGASPSLIADLEAAVRKANPYLLAANNETLEAVQKQIRELQEQERQILERMRGEDSSATS